MRDWNSFLAFLYQLPSKLNPGRQGIRVVRDSLQALIERQVLPQLSESEKSAYFPLGYSPLESDLKLAAGIGLERGYITLSEYETAVRADKAAGPFGFLQTLSGKTFGETVAPQIAQYWLEDSGDQFVKKPSTDLYDLLWILANCGLNIRIELKASTEGSPVFQQIRHPRMTNPDAEDYEYDVLLCLHASNAGLEWWAFPAAKVAEYIANGMFPPQHGGQKMESGTYWVRMDKANRPRFAIYQVASEALREFVKRLT